MTDLNFGDLYDAVAAAFPRRTAIISGEQRLSWQELDVCSNRLARTLAGAGLEPGSKVAFYLRNSPAYVLLWNACVKGRFVHANVNYRYVEEELFYLLDNADSEAVAYDAEFRPQVEQLRPRLPRVRLWLEVGDASPAPFAAGFGEACRAGDGAPLDIERSGDDLYFMYTGGTTGYPKAVMWPARERIAAIGMTDAADVASHVARLVSAGEPPVLLTAAPMMHSTGLTSMMSCLVQGGCVVIPPMQRFDAEVCLQNIDNHRVTQLALVGDAFSLPLLDTLRESGDRFDLSSVRLINSAGAMWSGHVKQELLTYFSKATLSDSLGASEGSRLASAVTTAGERSTTARFVLGPHARVFREDHTEVTPGSGEAGLLATAGAIPLGYYKDPEKTAATFPVIDGVRYSMPGDWVRVAADGSMELLGRGSHCINTGGEKVFPEEVEEALKCLPQIVDAAVVGLPDERFGQVVTALLRTSSGAEPDLANLRTLLAKQIASYKHPRRIVVAGEDFRHANGKVNYRLVRRLLDPQAAAKPN